MKQKIIILLSILSIGATLSSCNDTSQDASSLESITDSSQIASQTQSTTTTTKTTTTTATTTTKPEVTYPIGEEIIITGTAARFNTNKKTFIIYADNKDWTIKCSKVDNFAKLKKMIESQNVKIICNVTGRASLEFKTVEINNKTYAAQSFKKETTTTMTTTIITTAPPTVLQTNPPETTVDNSSRINYYRSLINGLNNDIAYLEYRINDVEITIAQYKLKLENCEAELNSAKDRLYTAQNTYVEYYTGSGWSTGVDASKVNAAQKDVNYWKNTVEKYNLSIESCNNNINNWRFQINSKNSQIQEYQNNINSLQ